MRKAMTLSLLASLGAALAGAACGDSQPTASSSASLTTADRTASDAAPIETTPLSGKYRFVKPPLAVYWEVANPYYVLYVRMNQPLPRKSAKGGGGQRGHLLLNEQIEGNWYVHGTVNGRKVCYASDYYKEDGPPDSSLFPWSEGKKLTTTYELRNKPRARASTSTVLKRSGSDKRALKKLGCRPLK